MLVNDKHKFFFIFQTLWIIAFVVLKNYLLYLLPVLIASYIAIAVFVKFLKRGALFKVFCMLFSFLSYCLYFRAVFLYSGFEEGSADRVVGELISDTSLTKTGSSFYSVKLEEASFSSLDLHMPATLNIIAKSDRRGIYGEKWCFYNLKALGDNVFSAERAERIKGNILADIRRAFLVSAEKRVASLSSRFRSDDYYYAHLASLKLLTARASGEDDELSSLIKKVGIEYIFALSGMHLNLIALAIRKILFLFFSKKYTKYATLLPVSLYFFLVSRSPSFVRAYIMFVFSLFMSTDISLPLSFFVQVLLCPCSSTQIGFDYSYLAISGIFLTQKLFYLLLSLYTNKKIASVFSFSFSAVSFSSLVSIINFGSFKPLGIFIAPFASFLAGILLFCGAGLFIFRASALFSLLAKSCYASLVKLLKLFSPISFSCSWVLFVSVWFFFIVCVILFLKGQRNKRRVLALL